MTQKNICIKINIDDFFCSNAREITTSAGHTCCFQAQQQGCCGAKIIISQADLLLVKTTNNPQRGVEIFSGNSEKISTLLKKEGIKKNEIIEISIIYNIEINSKETECCF